MARGGPGHVREAEVVVVGAGLAGMVAARRVAEAGRSVLVLEARDRVGGRVLGHDLGDGQAVEEGGQWVGPTQHRVGALIRELGLALFPTYDEGEHVFQGDGKRHLHRGDYPSRINPLVLADFGQAFLRLERLARRVRPDAPWRTAGAARLDGQTVETWIRRNLRSATAGAMMRATVRAVFAAEPANISLLHALFYVRSGDGLKTLIGVRGGAQQDRVVGGSHRIAARLAEDLGDRVVLGAPVQAVQRSSDRVQAVGDGVVVEARRAVVAVPPALAAGIEYRPPLPPGRAQLVQRMPHGYVIKANVVYPEPFWRAEGLSGQAFDVDAPFSLVLDNTPASGSPGVLVGFFEGMHALWWGHRPAEERRREALRSLVRAFGPRAGTPDAYVERDWTREEWTRGCYGAHFPPGVWTQYGPFLRQPVGRIHWAGSETAIRWNGYMDGAVESGERAASEVLTALAEE